MSDIYLCRYCRTALSSPDEEHPCLSAEEKREVDKEMSDD
jgi:hypothetical protein